MIVLAQRGGSLDPQGPVAEAMADLWWFMLALGLVVFIAFGILLALGLRRTPPQDGEGDSRRRIRYWVVGGGVVMPVVVLVAVFAATLYAMRVVPTSAPADALVVEIVGRQFRYDVHYPEQGVSATNELHIPTGRPIALKLTSVDVIHSFWVPPLGGKMDMLPDRTNTLVLEADGPGIYRARCAEFCGLNHAHMELEVVAESPERFAEWMAAQQ